MTNQLARIGLPMFPQLLLANIADEFQLGDMISYTPLPEEFFSPKFKLVTNHGQYFIKIFSPEKTLQRVRSITNALRLIYETGLPVPRIYSSAKGTDYFLIELNGSRPVYVCVLDWFEGEDFTSTDVSVKELELISRLLAEINSLAIELVEHYDCWFTTNLALEWQRKQQYVSEERYRKAIVGAVERFESIELAKLTTGTVHGDLGRQNLIKGKNNICIVDFDALNISSIAADLAVAMSHFCLSLGVPCEETFLERCEVMLNEYLRHVQLCDYEIDVLPILLESSYAIYYIQGVYYHERGWQDGKWWKDLGRKGLDMIGRIEQRVSLSVDSKGPLIALSK